MYQIMNFMGRIEIHGNDDTESLPKKDYDGRPLPMGTKAYIIDSNSKKIIEEAYDAENETWVELN